jgi:hypothetical protein
MIDLIKYWTTTQVKIIERWSKETITCSITTMGSIDSSLWAVIEDKCMIL